MTARAPRVPRDRTRPATRPTTQPAPAAGTGPSGPAGRHPSPPRPPDRDVGADRLDRLAAGFVQAFLEVESGLRPRAQLAPVLCPHLAGRLMPVWVRGGDPGRVVRTYGVRVAPGRYEAVALVRRGQRVGALVVALARTAGGWRVVDAARPEDAPTGARAHTPSWAPDAPEGATQHLTGGAPFAA